MTAVDLYFKNDDWVLLRSHIGNHDGPCLSIGFARSASIATCGLAFYGNDASATT